ncbi:olfactory receptor-like protein DTMT [Lissotriton helveticus]
MKCSVWVNQTGMTVFLLLGFSDYPDQRLLFFSLFFILYLLSLLGNIFIITAIHLDPRLHTPMYFFLRHLSFADLCLPSVTIPKLLHSLRGMSRTISYLGCLAQIYMIIWLATTEIVILTVMAYDRYVAVCRPLHYRMILSEKLCVLLVVVSWGFSCLHAFLYISIALSLCFCGNILPSFFCDFPVLIKLSCSDTTASRRVLLVESYFEAVLLFSFVLGSYTLITKSILKLRSAQSRQKAFLTCSSHLIVIILHYGAGVSMYLVPSSASSQQDNTAVSLMYTLVIPLLNPLIYSLRKKEIGTALTKGLWWKYRNNF